jgi:uncharacterized membrane protein HdeD (DUF308 family)
MRVQDIACDSLFSAFNVAVIGLWRSRGVIWASSEELAMTAADVQTLDIQFTKDLAQNWGWFLFWGILLLATGIAAVWRSMTATLASMLFFGWLLAFAAAIEIVQAVMVGHWAGFFQHALAAILFGVLALIFLVRPMITAEVLTLVMALFFLVGGLFQIVGSAVLQFSGWGWHLIDGLITIVLGVLILAQWPASGLWVIGLFIGIDLIFYGLAWIAIAFGLRGSA